MFILPHEHEEEASSGHQGSSTGWRQHAQHGNNYETHKNTWQLEHFAVYTKTHSVALHLSHLNIWS